MNDIKDGGSAFPVPYSNEADGPTVMPTQGMSLRDYFAAKAMQALVTGTLKVDDGLPPTPETLAMAREYADASYVLADAMLKARQS